MSDPKHILIVRLGAIGDVVHALPVLSALRRSFPDARISWVVEALSAPVIEGHPLLDRLWVLPYRKKTKARDYMAAVWRAGKEMKQAGVDTAIDLQGLTKSSLVAWLSGASRRIGFAGEDGREFTPVFMNRRVMPDESDDHVVMKNLALLRGLGINEPGTPEFVFPDFTGPQERMSQWWGERFDANDRVAFINPGAGWETKRVPVATLREVAERLATADGWRIVTLWGPRERAMAEEITRGVEAKAGAANAHLAPETGLQDMIELTRRAGLFIGGDTGPTQIAAALGVPTLSLFGGSDSRRNAPFGSCTTPLQDFSISCVPCWKMKCRLTGDKHLICLKVLTADRIMDGVERVLAMR